MEETLAIMAANLALSRALYLFFKDYKSRAMSKKTYQHTDDDASKHHALNGRRTLSLSLTSQSRDSVIPLENTIKRTTDLSVVHEPRFAASESGSKYSGNTHIADDLV